MCCCDKPTINGKMGYKWNQPNGPASIRPVQAPDIQEGDTILFDEPGRCGRGIDSHCHHYRVVKGRYDEHFLLVRHGGGDERIPWLCSAKAITDTLHLLDSNGRYWLLNAMYHMQSDSKRKASAATSAIWQKAAVEKRIKTRKMRNSDRVRVWIESAPLPSGGLSYPIHV